MRWVIVGPYPPERGHGADLTAAETTRRLDAGDDVVVISPRPSAAHLHQPLTGRAALRSLHDALAAGDGFWARVEPGVLLRRDVSRLDALVDRYLLRRVLRRAGRSVLDVGDAGVFPGGRAGALVFGAVDQIVVHSPDDRTALVAAGAPEAKVVLAEVGGASPATPQPDPAPSTAEASPAPAPPPHSLRALPADAGRAGIEAAVRSRATEAPVRRA